MPQIDFALVFAILKWFAYGCLAIYVFVAIGLSMLAARLEMRGGWMAWVPILNLYLLCRMARASAVMILPALIPVFGLAVLAYLGVKVARRLDMSAGVGVLFGVPFIGALVPMAMALGSAPIPEDASGGEPSRKPIIAGIVSVAVAAILAGMGWSAFYVTGRMTRKDPPSAKAVIASLPAKTASTLTEFPLDTATVNPMRPTRVVMQSFEKPKPGGKVVQVTIAPAQLPPWIAPESLPADVESIAAADYVSADGGEPVRVATLVMREEDSSLLAQPSAQDIAKAGDDARATGIEVSNEQGETYRGYKVSGSEGTFYAVAKKGTNIGVLISASDDAGAVKADRLARNLGVGDGLLQDGDYAGIFGELPTAPNGSAWDGTFTMTGADIEEVVRMVEHEAANLSAEESAEAAAFMPLVKQARSLAPARVGAGYIDGGDGQRFAAGIASYSNSRSAWLAFSAAEMVKRMVPIPEEIVIRPATIEGAGGYYISMRDGQGFVLRTGSSIVGLAADQHVPEAQLRQWAEAYVRKQR